MPNRARIIITIAIVSFYWDSSIVVAQSSCNGNPVYFSVADAQKHGPGPMCMDLHLEKNIPDDFRGLKGLKMLMLEKYPHSSLFLPSELEILYMQSSSLTTFPLENTLPSLYSLILNDNQLPRLDFDFSLTPSLVVLHVGLNRLDYIDPKIALLKGLRLLNISENKIGIFPLVICELTNLEYLDISDNSISELPSCLIGLKRLHTFMFNRNKVTSLPPGLLSLPELRVIGISGNQLTRTDMEKIKANKEILLR